MMASAGLENILIAYPVVGQSKCERLAKLAQHKTITVSLDSIEVAQGISEAATRAGSKVNILVEFDVGMRRCGLQTVDAWLEVAQAVDKLSGVRLLRIDVLSRTHLGCLA